MGRTGADQSNQRDPNERQMNGTRFNQRCHLSRAALLAELRAYEAGIHAIERQAERLGGDSPELVDGDIGGLVWNYQWSHIAAALGLEGQP